MVAKGHLHFVTVLLCFVLQTADGNAIKCPACENNFSELEKSEVSIDASHESSNLDHEIQGPTSSASSGMVSSHDSSLQVNNNLVIFTGWPLLTQVNFA